MPKVKPPAIVAKAPAQAVATANLLMHYLSEIKQPLGRQVAELMRQVIAADQEDGAKAAGVPVGEYRRVLLGMTGAEEATDA